MQNRGRVQSYPVRVSNGPWAYHLALGAQELEIWNEGAELVVRSTITSARATMQS
jgi:hypothetical protein